MVMSRKLGQIIAVRENTWMIRIPMGCDPQTKQRSYYSRTVHGSLRQAQKFLGKKINELGASIERDGAKIRLDQYLDQWLKTIKLRICSKTYESYESLLAKYIRPSLGKNLWSQLGRWTSKGFTNKCQIANFRQERCKGLIGCSLRRSDRRCSGR
jgi:hypothetical protein